MKQPSSAGAQQMTPLGRKLTWFGELSAEDIAVLDTLHATTRLVRRNRDIVSEGRNYETLFVLQQGCAIRYRVLHDGRRQILNILLPGDFVGFPGCFFENALYAITALSDVVVCPVPFAVLIGLFEHRPRLAATIFWSFACEAAIYAERLIDIGRRSAIERVAHFLLELLTRLRTVGLADENSVSHAVDPGADRRCARPERSPRQPHVAAASRRRSRHHRRAARRGQRHRRDVGAG